VPSSSPLRGRTPPRGVAGIGRRKFLPLSLSGPDRTLIFPFSAVTQAATCEPGYSWRKKKKKKKKKKAGVQEMEKGRRKGR